MCVCVCFVCLSSYNLHQAIEHKKQNMSKRAELKKRPSCWPPGRGRVRWGTLGDVGGHYSSKHKQQQRVAAGARQEAGVEAVGSTDVIIITVCCERG